MDNSRGKFYIASFPFRYFTQAEKLIRDQADKTDFISTKSVTEKAALYARRLGIHYK